MRPNVREAPGLAADSQDDLSSSGQEQSTRLERPSRTIFPQRSRSSAGSCRRYLLQSSSRFQRKIQSLVFFLHQPSHEGNLENRETASCLHHNQCDRRKTAVLGRSDSPPLQE